MGKLKAEIGRFGVPKICPAKALNPRQVPSDGIIDVAGLPLLQRSVMYPFTKLQAAMHRLRFKDESALRGLGLAKLSKTFDAYPIVDDGQKIFVLLPSGMDPALAQKLESQAAAKTVVVLTQGAAGVAKIWPTPEAVAEAAKAKAPAPAPKEEPAEASIDFEIVEE